jgi:hypothetical protein
MAKQITLDGISRQGINIFKEGGVLRVEANYHILAGTEAVRTVSRDITAHLSPTLRSALAEAYDTVFARIEQVELT